MKSSCWSLFLSLYSRPLITLSINLVGKSVFLNLFLIIFFSFVKSVLVRFDLCKSPIITLPLYFLSILEFQGVDNLVSLQWADVIKIPFWNSKLVSKKPLGFGSNVNLLIFSDGNYLSHWTKDLLGSFYSD